MYTVFLAGGIASGKSTVARMMHERAAAHLIDFDELSRRVLSPGSSCLQAVCDAFGADLLQNGELQRGLLAERAFSSAEATALLESIELPYLVAALRSELSRLADLLGLCVVQVPLLDRIEHEVSLADEVLAVVAPLELRRSRAIARGMSPSDFDARESRQPSETYLCEHATYIIENDGDEASLAECVASWLSQRGFAAPHSGGGHAHG